MINFITFHLEKLKTNKISNPEFELRLLFNYCSINKKEIFLNDFNLNKINLIKFKNAFQRRIFHEPLSKIFNIKEFYSLNFYVNNKVLDPRPETEFIIDAVKDFFLNNESSIKICDLGTGSGCLAITLAKIYKNSKILATDISKDALNVAKKNAIIHNVQNRIDFKFCNWIKNKKIFDIIVCNPPYLSEKDYIKCDQNIRKYEPKIALLGGKNGLKYFSELSIIFREISHHKSLIFVEIGHRQLEQVLTIFKNNDLIPLKIIKDYQQINRVIVLKKRQRKKKLEK